MKDSGTTAIKTQKENIRMKEWKAQIEAQQTSGMTVQKWCKENDVNIKTYYYHLHKVRERYLDERPAIVQLTASTGDAYIEIEKNGLQIRLPSDIPYVTLSALVHELC